MTSKLRMIVSGGGTGGHFFPALSICQLLKKEGVIVKFIGSKYGIEKNLINNHFNPHFLNIHGIQRNFSFKSILKNILFPFKFIIAYFESIKIINDFKPHVVIGTGGYSSGLPLLSALHKGIKTVIQEQNSSPGITTKYLARKVDKVCIAFPGTKLNLMKNNFIITGNPIRSDITLTDKLKAKSYFNLDNNKPVLAVLGGSQGARSINSHLKNNINKYTSAGLQILWQCGRKDFAKLKSVLTTTDVKLFPFIKEMNYFYTAADIIISRSGALAISEMALLGKAMVLIPLPSSSAGHQLDNAKYFSNKDAAILIEEADLSKGILEENILNLINKPLLIKKMQEEAIKLSFSNANNHIKSIIMELAIK